MYVGIAVVTKPPYEITETGWGEFEIIIKIFFIDPNERPVSACFNVQYLFEISIDFWFLFVVEILPCVDQFSLLS